MMRRWLATHRKAAEQGKHPDAEIAVRGLTVQTEALRQWTSGGGYLQPPKVEPFPSQPQTWSDTNE